MASGVGHGPTVAGLFFEPKHLEDGISSVIQEGPIMYSLIVSVVIAGMIMSFRSSLAKAQDTLVPEEGLNIRNFFELLLSPILGFMEDIIGHHYRTYVPLVLGLWVFILFSNFLGLIPFFEPPTSTYSNTFALAVIVFIATHYYGMKAHGLGYFKHFISPVWPPSIVLIIMAPLYLVIELIGHFARILSLSIRLMANMTADHTVIAIFLALVAPFVPSIFSGLGIIVCVLQAFIFTLLTIIYIAIATAEEH